MTMTMSGISCGKCKGKHPSVADVRACYAGRSITPADVRAANRGYQTALADPAAAFAADGFLSDAEETRLIQAAEREEDERVAAYKAQRDARSMGTARVGGNKQGAPVASSQPNTKTNPACIAVPAGRYAVRGADNTVDFYKIDKPEKGKWVGFTFASLLIGSIGDFVEQRQDRAHAVSLCEKIVAAGIEESARLFGQKAKRCGQCLSPLTTVQSRAAGYGQKCAGNHGFWYPTEAEARELLGEEA